MNDMKQQLYVEKSAADSLRKSMNCPNDELIVLRKALLDCERQLDLEKRNKKYGKSEISVSIQTDDKQINDLITNETKSRNV